jgi:hypothetical protein
MNLLTIETGVSTMLNQQHMADNLKAVAHNLPTPNQRRDGMNAVKRLENAQWLPEVFEQIVEQSAGFEIQGNDLVRVKGHDRPVDAVIGLVNAYMTATNQEA